MKFSRYNYQKLLVHLNVRELQELIANSISEEVKKITKVIQMIPTENDEQKFITREEASKLLRVSLTTLYLWNKNHILRAKKMGKRVYYFKQDVINKLNSAA